MAKGHPPTPAPPNRHLRPPDIPWPQTSTNAHGADIQNGQLQDKIPRHQRKQRHVATGGSCRNGAGPVFSDPSLLQVTPSASVKLLSLLPLAVSFAPVLLHTSPRSSGETAVNGGPLQTSSPRVSAASSPLGEPLKSPKLAPAIEPHERAAILRMCSH
uniref:Uncharacterized protein n=1 Tax=Micrurus spixii TaxID=129469 RepID=A0A2D4M5V9_9SAUR